MYMLLIAEISQMPHVSSSYFTLVRNIVVKINLMIIGEIKRPKWRNLFYIVSILQ